VTRVFVSASSPAELEGLEAVVRSGPSLEFVGGNVGVRDQLEEIEDSDPEVLLLRVSADALDDPRLAVENWPPLPSILIVEESEFASAVSAMQAEDSTIRGVLPAWATDREIQVALEAVATGLLVLHSDVAERVSTAPTQSLASTSEFPGEALSPRESEVLNLLAAGLGNKEIAARLNISDHTVKFHVTSIFNKLNVSSRAEAVAVGIRRGLIAI
jgi:NarL family two-component system response regulator YdfI